MGRGGGRSLRAAPAGARASVARKWAGAGKGRPCRRGSGEGARHFSPAPRTGVPTRIGGGGSSRKVYRGKAWYLGGWEAGKTEATVREPRNPGRGCLYPKPPYPLDLAKLRLGLRVLRDGGEGTVEVGGGWGQAEASTSRRVGDWEGGRLRGRTGEGTGTGSGMDELGWGAAGLTRGGRGAEQPPAQQPQQRRRRWRREAPAAPSARHERRIPGFTASPPRGAAAAPLLLCPRARHGAAGSAEGEAPLAA